MHVGLLDPPTQRSKPRSQQPDPPDLTFRQPKAEVAFAGTKWRTEGHEWIGKKVKRVLVTTSHVGTVKKWAPGGAAPQQQPPLWRIVRQDGVEEDLNAAEAPLRRCEACVNLNRGTVAG